MRRLCLGRSVPAWVMLLIAVLWAIMGLQWLDTNIFVSSLNFFISGFLFATFVSDKIIQDLFMLVDDMLQTNKKLTENLYKK
jgi:hypothetical protein